MEFLGVGPSELVFVILIAIIILGPKDMQKAGRTIGRWLNQLIRSDSWKIFQRTSTEIRNLPSKLMREANMELQDVDKEIRQTIDPRSYPPIFPASPSPSAESSAPAASDKDLPAPDSSAGQAPSNPTDDPLPPPTVDNTNNNVEKDD